LADGWLGLAGSAQPDFAISFPLWGREFVGCPASVRGTKRAVTIRIGGLPGAVPVYVTFVATGGSWLGGDHRGYKADVIIGPRGGRGMAGMVLEGVAAGTVRCFVGAGGWFFGNARPIGYLTS